MSRDYGGYFYTTKNGVRVFVPDNKEDSLKLAKELNKNASRSKTGRLSRENMRIAQEAKERFGYLQLRFSEPWMYEVLCEAFDENLTPEEKGSPLVCDEYGDRIYVAINFGFNNYMFIGAYPIGSLDYNNVTNIADEEY